jgi:hypothetical protein
MRAVDALGALNLKKLSQATPRWLGFDAATAGKSWRATSLRGLKVVETLRAAGGSGVQITGDETAMAWCRGEKSFGAAR